MYVGEYHMCTFQERDEHYSGIINSTPRQPVTHIHWCVYIHSHRVTHLILFGSESDLSASRSHDMLYAVWYNHTLIIKWTVNGLYDVHFVIGKLILFLQLLITAFAEFKCLVAISSACVMHQKKLYRNLKNKLSWCLIICESKYAGKI